MTEFKHTPGPWRWELNNTSKQIQLCGGKPMFDLTVMDFERWGMNGAIPRIREDRDGLNLMRRVDKWAVPVAGREHHASWFQSVDHPDMRLIEQAPSLLAALESLVEKIHDAGWHESELDEARQVIAAARNSK